MYYIAKTLAEKAALEYGRDEQLQVITLLPALVGGPSFTPTFSLSSFTTLAPITATIITFLEHHRTLNFLIKIFNQRVEIKK